MVPLAFLTGFLMLAAWFPLMTLWHQQSQLDAVGNQIAQVQAQQRTLAAESKSISSTAAATELARQQYQLVQPGQSLIQVLPGRDGGGSAAGGDPGLQPLVSPSSVNSLIVPGRVATAHAHRSGLKSFLTRLARTLEFWR